VSLERLTYPQAVPARFGRLPVVNEVSARRPVNRANHGGGAIRRGWSAVILAIILGLIGIVLTIGGVWVLALGGSPYYCGSRPARLSLVVVPGPDSRRLGLHWPVHPDQQDGREYLVIFAGGDHFMETPMGDSVIAYAPPR
jgi:hypothetical protein